MFVLTEFDFPDPLLVKHAGVCSRGHRMCGRICERCSRLLMFRVQLLQAPAERLDAATLLLKPYTYKNGRRHGPGLISKKQFLALVNAKEKQHD